MPTLPIPEKYLALAIAVLFVLLACVAFEIVEGWRIRRAIRREEKRRRAYLADDPVATNAERHRRSLRR